MSDETRRREPRFGYDHDEGIFFDRERPVCSPFDGEEQQYEEVTQSELIAAYDALARECDALKRTIQIVRDESLAFSRAQGDRNRQLRNELERAEAKLERFCTEVDYRVSKCETWQGVSTSSYTAMPPFGVASLRSALRTALADAAPTEEPNDGE